MSNKRFNTFVINEKDPKVTTMYDFQGNSTLIDTEDIERLQPYYWYKNTRYWVHISTRGRYLLHRFIMNCPKDKCVDHISHNKDDNRKSELRVCTYQQNQINKTPVNRKLPTGIYETPYGRYQAMLRTKEVRKFKTFNTLEEAIEQRYQWEEEYFGEYRYKE